MISRLALRGAKLRLGSTVPSRPTVRRHTCRRGVRYGTTGAKNVWSEIPLPSRIFAQSLTEGFFWAWLGLDLLATMPDWWLRQEFNAGEWKGQNNKAAVLERNRPTAALTLDDGCPAKEPPPEPLGTSQTRSDPPDGPC